MKLTLSQINEAVDSAFASAFALPVQEKVAAQSIGDNCTLRTDVYSGLHGTGFAVVATLDLGWRTQTIVKQHGPENWREIGNKTLEQLIAECHRLRQIDYPSHFELIDGQGKQLSGCAEIRAKGNAQVAKYWADREATKMKYPIPQ